MVYRMMERDESNYNWFRAIYEDEPIAPWDIGYPQKFFVENAERFVPGHALDVGCGTGEISIFLAKKGFDIIGIDYIEKPILQARKKIENTRLSIEFRVQDAFEIDRLWNNQFDYVFDGGFLHNLSDQRIKMFEPIVYKVLKPQGKYVVMGIDPLYEPPSPRGIDQKLLESMFKAGWRIVEIKKIKIESLVDGLHEEPGIMAIIEKIG